MDMLVFGAPGGSALNGKAATSSETFGNAASLTHTLPPDCPPAQMYQGGGGGGMPEEEKPAAAGGPGPKIEEVD
jgi:hypothetical protein